MYYVKMKHPNFKDVAWLVKKTRSYKKGYIDVIFMWIYPKNGYRDKDISIFGSWDKKRIKLDKWREFIGYD